MAMTDKNQKRLMFALPFIFVPFIISFPAGLMVYWITTNAWTIGQQLLIRKVLPPPHLHDAKGDEVEEDEEPGEKRGLRGMLDEIREAAGFEKEEEPAGNGKSERGRDRAAAKAGGKGGSRSSGSTKTAGGSGAKRAGGAKAGGGAKGDGASPSGKAG